MPNPIPHPYAPKAPSQYPLPESAVALNRDAIYHKEEKYSLDAANHAHEVNRVVPAHLAHIDPNILAHAKNIGSHLTSDDRGRLTEVAGQHADSSQVMKFKQATDAFLARG